MGRALRHYLAQAWATDPHHLRPPAQTRKKGTPTMNHIRRAFPLTAAAALAAIVTVTASACSGPTTATGPPANGTTATTNGLENKSPAEVQRAAAAALGAVKSVHIVGADLDGHFDVRMQRGSAIVTITYPRTGGHARFRVIGRYGYAMTDFGHNAGRWLRYPAQAFKEFTLGEYAPFGYRPHGAKVQQATVNGKKVVVLSWPDGSWFQVANTGPAYPLRAKFKGGYPAWVVFSEYNVPFDVTAPSNAIDYRQAG